jgi:hypothetical protein
MCLPVAAIVGIAASLAGAGLNYVGQRKADKAANRTFQAERNRQKGFEKEQIGKFEDSLASTAEAAGPDAQAKAAAAREAEFSEATKSADPKVSGYLPGSSSAPSIVSAASDKAGAASDARTAQLSASLARLGGLTDVLQKNDIQIGRNSQDISQVGGFARGSRSVLQAELEAAKRKGGTLRTLGGLAQSLGAAALSGGFGGGVDKALPIDVLSQGSLVPGLPTAGADLAKLFI